MEIEIVECMGIFGKVLLGVITGIVLWSLGMLVITLWPYFHKLWNQGSWEPAFLLLAMIICVLCFVTIL